MSKTIDPRELKQELDKYFNEYVEDINDVVVESVNTISKEARDELVKTSPKSGIARNTKYYKGWAIKIGAKTRQEAFKYTKVIYNRTNYQLTHLLEFGHLKANGTGRVAAKPHIRPVEEKYGIKCSDLLGKNIRRISQ